MRLRDELAHQMEEAMDEFHYSTKTDFMKDAIREKLKELSSERRVASAWHKLLTGAERSNETKGW